MTTYAKPCVLCGKQLENVYDQADNQPEDGSVFVTHGSYGSTVFDPMDGSFLQVNICDPCLEMAALAGRVTVGRDRRPVIVNDGPHRVIVGWEDLRGVPDLDWHAGMPSYREDDVLEVDFEQVGTDMGHRIHWLVDRYVPRNQGGVMALSQETLDDIRELADRTTQGTTVETQLSQRLRTLLVEVERLRTGIKDIATGNCNSVWEKAKALLEGSE